MKKLSLILGGLLLTLLGIFAADNSGTNSDLSAAATQSYQIRNKQFGGLLRPENANGAEGTRIVLYPAEPWKCMTWKLQPAGESAFHVQNHFTSKTFVVKPDAGESRVIQIKLAHEKSDQPLWQFTKQADGWYEISDAKSGEALTAVAETGGSARVIVAPWNGGENQKWSLEKIDPATLTM
jgi:hypothetical protein